MKDIFIFAFNSVAPIILLIILGYFLKIINFYQDSFLKIANKLVFKVLLPVLLFFNIYNIESLASIDLHAIGYALAIILLLFFLGLITSAIFVKDKRQKGVIVQCIFRSNFAIIGFPIAEAIGGSEAASVVAILSAFTIPLFNILAVISLSIYSTEDNNTISIKKILKEIAFNPLIRGVAFGLLFILIRSFIPVNSQGELIFTIKNNMKFLYCAIEDLAAMASPLALIVLGGQFTFKSIKDMKGMIFLGTFWRIVLAPAIGILGAILLTKYTAINIDCINYPAYIALFGSPVAVSSAIMAGAMGSDESLAGQLVVWTSLGSLFTIFIIVFLLKFLFII